jgi:hypothetical protein
MKLCVNADSEPVVLALNEHGLGELLEFGQPFVAGQPPASAFASPPGCGQPGPTCPDGASVRMEVVVFHPTNMFDIAGQDVADWLGDTMFLCLAGPNATSAGQQYMEISLWEIEVWTGYGLYSLCNG